LLEPVSPAQASRRVTDVKRAAALVLVMLAMTASAAVDARTLASEGQKTQWAPTRNFSSLNARAVFAGESRRATSPYAGEEGETAAGGKEAGFTGHRLEDALGFSYAKRRWLDSSTGTFVSRDDIGTGSYLLSPNEQFAHGYAAGNPTRFVDSDGRRPQTLQEQDEIGRWRLLAWILRQEHESLLASQSPARRWLTNSPIGTGPGVAESIEVLERNIRSRERAIEAAADGVPVDEGAEPGGFNFTGVSPYRVIRFSTAESPKASISLPVWPNWHAYTLVDSLASSPRNGPFDTALSLVLLKPSSARQFAARSPGTRGGLPRSFGLKRTPGMDRAVRKFLGLDPPQQPANPFAKQPPDSPFYTPYDPRFPGRPDPSRTIDTRGFTKPASTNANGFPRDPQQFWQQWANQHPETISDANRDLMRGVNPKTGKPQRPIAPRIDDQWLKYFPEHSPWKHEGLDHHHYFDKSNPTGGPHAGPAPGPVHSGAGTVPPSWGPYHGEIDGL